MSFSGTSYKKDDEKIRNKILTWTLDEKEINSVHVGNIYQCLILTFVKLILVSLNKSFHLQRNIR